MGGHGLTIGAGEADIHQSVSVQKVLEWGEGVETVVVPFQVELLGLHDEEDQEEKARWWECVCCWLELD